MAFHSRREPQGRLKRFEVSLRRLWWVLSLFSSKLAVWRFHSAGLDTKIISSTSHTMRDPPNPELFSPIYPTSQTPINYPHSNHSTLFFFLSTGNHRRPPRPPTQQESLGSRDQGRSLSITSAHLAKTKRRGGRQGKTVQLRAGGECEERKGVDDGGGGGFVSGLLEIYEGVTRVCGGGV